MKFHIPPEFDDATNEQRIAFVQELWDRIADDPSSVPMPDSHKRVLDERLDDYHQNLQQGKPWGEVRDEILAKLRSR